MSIDITSDNTLKDIENKIQKEICEKEFWGDLDVTVEQFEVIGSHLKTWLHQSGCTVEFGCKRYPHAITTYLVFFAIFRYDTNYWNALENELDIQLNPQLQRELGLCAKGLFDKYRFDCSVVEGDTHKYINPIIYQAGVPLDNTLEDLFYILSNDTYRVFDPRLIIDDLIDHRSYAIRKRLLAFLQRFRDNRAVDFIIEVYDAVISCDQRYSGSSRYSDEYSEWKEENRVGKKRTRRNKEMQMRPYIFFDEDRAGLSIMLPRITIDHEYLDYVSWIIRSQNGYERIIDCCIFGDEGCRYTGTLSVPIPPDELYSVSLKGDSRSDAFQWDIDGISQDKPTWFNQNGRLVRSDTIPSPYGILVISSNSDLIASDGIMIDERPYPNSGEYRILSIKARNSNEYISVGSIKYSTKPQITMSLQGKCLFGIATSNMYVEIPKLVINVDGNANDSYLELRVGNEFYLVNSLDGHTLDLEEIFPNAFNRFGTYSVRLYQAGRYLEQITFNLTPNFNSNYTFSLLWPRGRRGLNDRRTLQFERIDDWELSFEGCNVKKDEKSIYVYPKPGVGALTARVDSITDDYSFDSFEMPIKPFEYEIISLFGEKITDSSELFRADVIGITDRELWLTIKTYGAFTDKTYKLLLKDINGLSQEEEIRLNKHGSGNINLSRFYDTIRNSPLPLEVSLVCDNDYDNRVAVLVVSDHCSFKSRVQANLSRTHIMLDPDDKKDCIRVSRFGIKANEGYSLNLSGISKSTRRNGYKCQDAIGEGIYIVSDISEKTFAYEDEGVFSFSDRNGILVVPSFIKDIDNYKSLLKCLFIDILDSSHGAELQKKDSYRTLMDSEKLCILQTSRLDDCDTELLIAIAYVCNEKIENDLKNVLRKIMRKISVKILGRGDRYRIIEFLAKMNVPNEIFDICLECYSLILFYQIGTDDIEALASKIQNYSQELAMVLMMSANGSVRDCMWKYRSIIGEQAIRYFLSAGDDLGIEESNRRIYQFVKEEPNLSNKIKFDEQIIGSQALIQEMTDYEKWPPVIDLERIPDKGIYFAGIKYIDQYVNWYLSTHNKGKIKTELDEGRKELVKKYSDQLISLIRTMRSDATFGDMSKQYLKAVEARIDDSSTERSLAWYFYLQGIAAYISRLPLDTDIYDDIRMTAIQFMSEAFEIAPKLALRDILLAQVFIYLKRKEAVLCQ